MGEGQLPSQYFSKLNNQITEYSICHSVYLKTSSNLCSRIKNATDKSCLVCIKSTLGQPQMPGVQEEKLCYVHFNVTLGFQFMLAISDTDMHMVLKKLITHLLINT